MYLGECWAYLTFNLSAIPAGSSIDSVELHLSVVSGEPGEGSDAVYINRVTGSWTEGGITWNNKPSSTDLIAFANQGKVAEWVFRSSDFPALGTLVSNWVNGVYPNYGINLRYIIQTNRVGFYSKGTQIPIVGPSFL